MNSAFRRLALAAAFGLLGAASAAAQTAPTVTAFAQGVSSITWTWTPGSGAVTGYRVLSSTTPGLNISGDLPSTANSFTLTGFSTNTPGAVMVEAFGAGFAVDAATVSLPTMAAVPSGTTLLGTNGNQVSLSWVTDGNPVAPSTNAVTYVVNWTTATGIGILFSTNPTVAVLTSSASATISDLPGGQTVNFDVEALNSSGVPSGFDVVVSTFIQPLPNQSQISSGTFALGVSSITWFWSASTGALTYQLFSSSNGAVSPLLPASRLSYTQTGLSINTAYTDYVQSFDGLNSTNTAPFTRYTLAAPTTGLTVISLSTPTALNDSESALLAWGANGNPGPGPAGNPPGTSYLVQWWSNLTSTVSFSTAATSAFASNLYAGSTLYFTVQAQNGDGILSAFDSSFFGVIPSTAFPVASQVVPVGFAGILTFVVPNSAGTGAGVVTIQIASGTFTTAVNFSVSTPAANGTPFPSVGGGVADLPSPIHLVITADDVATGLPQQPLRPILMTVAYAAANFASNQTTLDIARFDTFHQVWLPLATSKIGSILSATTDHLSSFAVLSVGGAESLSSITIGPNPLRPVLNPGSLMTFRNLPAGCRVRIFSYVGEKLIDLVADGSGTVGWDGRNRRGSMVASGVYIALIEGAGTKRTFRVAIER